MPPALLALLAAALFGAATPASKRLLVDLAPLQLAGLVYLGAALGVAPVALRGGLAWPRDRANALRLAGAVALGGGLAPVLMLMGLRLARASSVSLWLNLELAATAALGAVCFSDALGRRGWLGVAGAVAAGVVLSLGEGPAGWRAGALVAAACLCWALDNHWTALIDGVGPATSTLWKGAVAGTANLALGLVVAPWSASPGAAAAALAIGALAYGASIALAIRAAHGLGATRTQLLFATAPLFGVALAVPLLGESVSGGQVVAAGLLAAAAALVLRDRHVHFHRHAALGHTHWHRHDDGHHLHPHPGVPASVGHSHWHEHDPLAHAHPHWPDLHHRHRH